MRVNSRYYDVSWDDFKKACKKQAPEGYKFKKNEIKNIYRFTMGENKRKRKQDKLADSK